MGNMVVLSYDTSKLTAEQDSTFLQMNNGGTDIFLQAMALSGSRLAKTTKQKELIIWISEHDQSVLGRGAVGFALSDMPFSIDSFDEDKAFLFDVADGMANKLGWESWGSTPNEEHMHYYIQEFRKVLTMFQADLIDPAAYEKWRPEPLAEFSVCEIHGVLHTKYGCIICNDPDAPLKVTVSPI